MSNWAHIDYSFVLELEAGWNLVSVPLVTGLNASQLGLVRGAFVARWDPSMEYYDKYFVMEITPGYLDFPIEAGRGYWIWASCDESVVLFGADHGLRPINITVPQGGGWAIIGFNSLNTTRKASEIPGMYTDGAISTVVAYRNGRYVQYVKGVPATEFTLLPGEGYFVFCLVSGTLTYWP